MAAFPKKRLHSRIGTFRQLEILIAVERFGGIAAAAKNLHLTQPNISMQMKKLSEGIGMPMYETVGKRLKFTFAGKMVLEYAKEIFACTDRLEVALNELENIKSGELSIGVVTSAEYFIPHLLGPFCRRYPNITVAIEIGNRGRILDRLTRNLDDLYIFGPPPALENTASVQLGVNHLVVIAPSSHPLASRPSLSWEDIAAEQFILREEEAGIRQIIDAQLKERGLTINRRMTIASNEGIKHAVLARMGLAIVPALSLDEGQSKQLVRLPVQGFPLVDHWHVVHRTGKVLSQVAELCKQYILNEGLGMYREATRYWEANNQPKLPTR
ncbi:LysR family transcriptional regulator [Alteromonas sp. 1_MG-2023]|uniref:LysR family transcriptional regulator n=1 Tax=Alteromonas sp. 1_MG-2023 TaxID=3062669 RepID=UPI0026E32615|nr:LysR family transcriptional regulator [Alteromonas sp. 1_MG-2023]MDO6475132.1 LysR family transcriptional regulator [Alteromonas sp. 1_MG-2023]